MQFYPTQVLFSPTTRCNLGCTHCAVIRTNKTLPIAPSLKFLVHCKKIGINEIGFTGGEPFLSFKFLLDITKKAISLNMFFDRISTNAVWWKTEKELKSKLSKLYKAGYDGSIYISLDAFHKQNLGKVKTFISAAVKIWNRQDLVAIAYVKGAKDKDTEKMIKTLAVLLNAKRKKWRNTYCCIQNDFLFVKLLRIELSPIGKAMNLLNPWNGKWFNEDYCSGPGNVFLVMPSGDIKPCCGYASDRKELTIGNIHSNSAKQILKNAAGNLFVSTIFKHGLSTIRKRLQDKGINFPGKTTNHCFFCDYVLSKIPRKSLTDTLI